MRNHTDDPIHAPGRRSVRWTAVTLLLLGVTAAGLTSNATAQTARLPKPGQILYHWLDASPLRSHIYIQLPGEPAARRVYDEPGIMWQAKWSPDGAQIAFSNEGIHVMDADGSNVRKLTDREHWSKMPHTWGPEDGQITFYEPADEMTGELLVLDVDNPGNQRFLYEGGKVDSAPAWSPDRGRLALCWREGRNPFDVYVMGADGGAVTRLTENARARDVAWSPDGKRLVYAAWTEDPNNDERGGSFSNVFVIDAEDGAAPRLVTTAEYHIGTPVWLAAGRRIAYALSGDVHVVNVASGEIHILGVRSGAPAISHFDWLDPFRAVSANGVLPSQWGRIKAPAHDSQTPAASN